MIGSLIGGAISAVGSIFGGIKASKAAKESKSNLKNERTENKNWYDLRYNEDATQRADAQRVLTQTEESIKNRNRLAAGVQAVMGGTDESVAASKAANNEALADATSRIAVAADARKDKIEEQYRQRDAQLANALNNLELNKANNIASAVKGVSAAAGSIGGSIDDWIDSRASKTVDETEVS